jgi:hypothetical protein
MTAITPPSVTSSLTLPSTWNPWTVASGSGFFRPFSAPLPEAYFPTNVIAFSGEFSNQLINLTHADLTLLRLLSFSAAGMTVALTVGMPISLNINYSRSGNSGTIGVGSPYRDFTPSPRYGYSVGNEYKHQAYFRLDIAGVGWLSGVSAVWFATFGTMSIENCSNCRLRKVYLSQGRILGIGFKKETDPATGEVVSKMTIKLHDKDIPPPKGLTVGGNIEVYSFNKDQPVKESLSITGILEDWSVVVDLKKDMYARVGDFFKLDKPILVEDPATMHDYGLKIDGQILRTDGQRYEISNEKEPGTGNIIGVWVEDKDPNIDEDFVFVAYVDEKNRSYVRLPESAFEAERNLESMKFGGSAIEGFNKIKSLKADTIRLILSVSGSPGAQNFCAGNLVGEFVEINKKHYEVLFNPRGDTIVISVYALEDDVSILKDGMTWELKMIQQNFWMTSEVYTNNGAGGTNGLYSAFPSKNTFNGKDNTTDLEWSTTIPLGFKLDEEETKVFKINNLLKRHFSDVGSSTSLTKAYSKFERWKILDVATNQTYRIKTITFKEKGADSYEIKATVYGGSDNSFKDHVSLFYDEPFENLSGSYANQYYSYATFAPALGPEGWTAVMNGYYDGGKFRFSKQVSKETQFSIVSNSLTVKPLSPKGSCALGNPFVYLSTQKTAAGLAYIEDPLTQAPFVFFNDPNYDFIAYRTAFDYQWTEERQQRLVRIGYYDLLPMAELITGPDYSTGFVTGMSFENVNPIVEARDGSNIYWVRMPQSLEENGCPFFSARISGVGGVDTPLFRRYGLDDKPVAESQPLPFEVYPNINKGRTVSFPAYLPVSKGLEGIGLESVGRNNAEAIISGGALLSQGNSSSLSHVEITPRKRLLMAPGAKDGFKMENGEIGLIYGWNLQSWKIEGGEANPSSTMLAITTSKNNGHEWGSPRIDKSKSGYKTISQNDSMPIDGKEWCYPLILLHDFDYAGVLFDRSTRDIFIFGWIYESGFHSEEEYLSLAIYRCSLPDIIKDDNVVKVNLDKTGEQIANFRGSKFNSSYGRTIKSPPEYTDKNLTEKFFKVIGNEKVQANNPPGSNPIVNKLFPVKRTTIATMWKGTSMVIFLPCDKYKGIISLFSNDLGETWKIETIDKEGKIPLLYAKDNSSFPVVLSPDPLGRPEDNVFFYIQGDVLWCKQLDMGGKGANDQEILDNNIPSVVAVGVQDHKAVATTDRTGRMIVYYLSTKGYISAAVSSDYGDNWTTLKNW